MADWANDDQNAYMADLKRIAAEKKCWCGWYIIAECQCRPKPPSLAERIKVECRECHNYPPKHDPTGPITHQYHCSKSDRATP